MTTPKDRYDFIMGCLLEGVMSNPQLFNKDALKRIHREGNCYLCGIVDACARIADEALDVCDSRYKYIVSKRDPPAALKSRPLIRKELAE